MLDKPISVVRRLQELRTSILDTTEDGGLIAKGLWDIANDTANHPKERIKAFEVLLERAWGRVPQEIDLTAPGSPIGDRPLKTYSVEELLRLDRLMNLDELREDVATVIDGQIVNAEEGNDA
jgi:hypothetical protein